VPGAHELAVEASTVVGDDQLRAALAGVQPERDPGGLAVAGGVGKALLGRKVGELATVETESGDSYKLKVLGIE